MVPPSRSGRGFGAHASGTVWEVGLVTMPAVVAQGDGSMVRPLIAWSAGVVHAIGAANFLLIPNVPALRDPLRGRS